jgi:hypothetical protein
MAHCSIDVAQVDQQLHRPQDLAAEHVFFNTSSATFNSFFKMESFIQQQQQYSFKHSSTSASTQRRSDIPQHLPVVMAADKTHSIGHYIKFYDLDCIMYSFVHPFHVVAFLSFRSFHSLGGSSVATPLCL